MLRLQVPNTGAMVELSSKFGAAPGEADALTTIGTVKSSSGVDITEKIKELVRLAQEQGYLTYGDITDALRSLAREEP